MTTTLICTVGGSHEPIVFAVRQVNPARVCFVCSADDPATGQRGSYTQITGQGKVIKASFSDPKPSLPSIPAQTGLTAEQFEVLQVAPDDFDDVYRQVSHWLAGQDRQQARIVADYTGGTKTMSAALVAAALDAEGVELQLVTGRRDNLVKVSSGSEAAVPASVETTRFQRRLREALSPWRRYAYDESHELLQAIPMPREPELRGQLQRAQDLSRAFALWDRFDHASAQAILTSYRPLLGERFGALFGELGLLNKDGPGREPMRILDLWRNAERRAAQGRYDDAVARLYRLLEWSAQWLLRERTDIDTAAVPEDKIPPHLSLTANREGRFQAGLYNAWALAAHHCGQDLAEFWNQEKQALLDHLKARNGSILAHGFEPLAQSHWQNFSNWLVDRLLPRLLAITGDRSRYRIGRLPEQLPDRYPL